MDTWQIKELVKSILNQFINNDNVLIHSRAQLDKNDMIDILKNIIHDYEWDIYLKKNKE